MGRGYYDDFYPPSRPIPAKGGIKAQSKSGRMGATWWAQRWIGVLERFGLGSRLTRGKSYARAGQVLAIEVEAGRVTAQVQGSQPTPYAVTITVTPLKAAEWDRVSAALAAQAAFAATLLGGAMPPDIETVFQGVGLSLFPASLAELKTRCSCPDSANPCKHIAAVYYLLGEEFDRDPFLLFRLRGLGRAALLERLASATPAVVVDEPAVEPAPAPATGAQRAAGPGAAGRLVAAGAPVAQPSAPMSAAETVALTAASEPLPAEATTFWAGGVLPADLVGEVRLPAAPAALLRRLGPFPFWRGEVGLMEALGPIYARAAPRGLDLVIGAAADGAGGG